MGQWFAEAVEPMQDWFPILAEDLTMVWEDLSDFRAHEMPSPSVLSMNYSLSERYFNQLFYWYLLPKLGVWLKEKQLVVE